MISVPEVQGQLLANRRRQVELLRQAVQEKKENGLAFYRPHKKQDKFHRQYTKKCRGAFTGNRFGKSTMGCAEDIAWGIGERTWYPESDPARRGGIPQRPTKGIVITTDWDKVDEIWTSQHGARPGKIWQLMPRNAFKSKRTNHTGAIDTIIYQNGSVLRFDTVKSYMNNPLGSESSDWDFVHVDEPCPEDMYKAIARGLVDRGGSSWFTLTPLREVWITDLFYNKRRDQRKLDEYSYESRWVIRGSMHDNPHLTEEAIKEYMLLLTDDEIECRINGLPSDLAGLVYKSFDPDKHILENVPYGWAAWNDPPLDYSIYYQIDPHPKTPHMVLFCAVSPFGQKFFYDEIFQHVVISDLCQMVKFRFTRREGNSELARNIIRGAVDPIAYVDDPITGTNMATEFERGGLYLTKATKDLMGGILRAEQELKAVNNCYFSPTLEETLWEFDHYVWDEKKLKPVDKDDHGMECFYRLCLMDMQWVPFDPLRDKPIEDMPITGDRNIHDLEEILD
jgi:hypothetical protein